MSPRIRTRRPKPARARLHEPRQPINNERRPLFRSRCPPPDLGSTFIRNRPTRFETIGCPDMLSRVVFLLLISELTLSTQAAAAGATGSDPKRVLIVNSYGTTAPPFSFQSTAFKT